MRVLWASHIIPYPPKSGLHLRCYHLLRGVAAMHEVDLIAFVQEPWLKIFYPSREAGLEDCRRELARFCRSVRFLPIDSLERPGGKWRTALEGMVCPSSYTIRRLQSGAARRAFADVARDATYALAHFDTLGLAPFRSLFAGVPATLGHHNIESHMLLRRAAGERNAFKRLYFLQEGTRVRRYEARVARSFAAHITCSDLDCERLRAVNSRANAIAIPNGVDVDYFSPSGSESATPSLIFVGSLNWYPNVDAVLFLLREIWPAVKRAVPHLRLDIVGSAPPPAIRDLAAGLQDVTVHGFVDDVRPLMEAATLYVCPIRDGGGTKLKLLDAFAMRKCVIAHPIACEGIDVVPGQHVHLADSAASFAHSVQRLLQQPGEREAMGRAARQLVVERYAFSQIGRRLCDVLELVAVERPPVR
jgi:polysaccharide biosynthesis protein PslH